MNFKKIISIAVATNFLLTFVVSPSVANISVLNGNTDQYNQIFSDFILPYSYGKITQAHFTNSDRVIINIQDLHCHPKVQKNISNIIETFDQKYGVNKIYLEGSFGKVSTQWLTDRIKNSQKEEILNKILETGRLTGAEYYSAKSGKTEIINGLEEKEPYLENLKRFGKIIENQEKINLILQAVEESSLKLKKQYYTKRQFKLEELSKSFKEDKISSQKYYILLSKHIDKLGIDLTKYENTLAYIMLLNLQSELNFAKITKEMQGLVLILKEKMPYGTYKRLIDNTDNFSKVDKLYGYIIKFCRQADLDLSVNFKNLDKYFRYIELSQKINPLELIKEETKLTEEINTRFSETKVQEDIVFMINFEKYLKDYVTSKITADDYVYYKENIENYKKLWNKYVDNRVLSLLDEYLTEADKFYEINTARNLYFAEKIFSTKQLEISNKQLAIDDTFSSSNIPIFQSSNLPDLSFKSIDIVITGGFHSQTVTEILKNHGVSYIVITPNVSDGIDFAEQTYYQIAKEQSKMSFQTIAPAIASVSPQAQQIIIDLLANPQQKKEISKLSDEERIKLISDLAAAKILESDETGKIEERIRELIKITVDDLHKGKVTPELVSKIKNLQALINDKEKLQKVIDLLHESNSIKQSVMLVFDAFDTLRKIFDSFIVSATEQLEKEEIEASRKDVLDSQGKTTEEFVEEDSSEQVKSKIKSLQNEVIKASGDNENIISYITKNKVTDAVLLNKILSELKKLKPEQKEIYCKIISLIEKEEYIFMFFAMEKGSRIQFVDFYEYGLYDYSDEICSSVLKILLDIIKEHGYSRRDFDNLYNYCSSRFIAELGTEENISNFLNLDTSVRRIIFNFYENSENDYDTKFSPLNLKFILMLAQDFNYSTEEFNYLMKLICRSNLREDNSFDEEFVESFEGKKVNKYILQNFQYFEFYNKYVLNLLFCDFNEKYITRFDFQKIIDLIDELQYKYKIESLELENKAFSLVVFFSKSLEKYCKENDIIDVTQQYQLAIRVSRRIYAIAGDNIFDVSYDMDKVIKETLEYYKKIDEIISRISLVDSKTAVFSIHHDERNPDTKKQRFTPAGLENIFSKLGIKPGLFEYTEIAYINKVLNFINVLEGTEINKGVLLAFLDSTAGSTVVKETIKKYIIKNKKDTLSKKTLTRYIRKIRFSETMVEANHFLLNIENFNKFSQEKGLFIFDGHGFEDGISYSDGKSFSVKQISRALINAHNNGVNLENITLMFSSCHSYKFAGNIINELINNGITVFPQIITDAGKETVYGYTKPIDTDNETITVSNLFYSLIKFLDSKSSEERKQMKGVLSFKDVADAPRYLSNNTIFVTNGQINELNHSLEQTIREIIEHDDDADTRRIYPIMDKEGMYVAADYNKYSQLLLDRTKQILDQFGNTKIIKTLYKENAGKNFKNTKLGTAIGVFLIEPISFWLPNFVEKHDFTQEQTAAAKTVVWRIKAFSIKLGLISVIPVLLLSLNPIFFPIIITPSILAKIAIAAFTLTTLTTANIKHYFYDITTNKRYNFSQKEISIPFLEQKQEKSRELSKEEIEKRKKSLEKTISDNDILYQYQPNPELKKEIEEIFENLLSAMVQQGKISEQEKKLYGIHYYYSPIANAYTVENSKDVFIFSELLYVLSEHLQKSGKLLTKDHIAAILAHELQHTTQENRVYESFSAIQGDDKRREYDADRESVFILEQSGYNPRAVEEVMSAFSSMSRTNVLAAFFDAHPNTGDRLKEISEILENPSLVFLSMNRQQRPVPVSDIHKYGYDLKKYVEENFEKDSYDIYNLDGKALQKIFEETNFLEHINIFEISRISELSVKFSTNDTKDFVFNNILTGIYKFFTKTENEFIKTCSKEEKEFIYALMNSYSVSYDDDKIIANLDDRQKNRLFDFCLNIIETNKIKHTSILFDLAASIDISDEQLQKFLDFRISNNINIGHFSEEIAYFYLKNYKYLTDSEKHILLQSLICPQRTFSIDNSTADELSPLFEHLIKKNEKEVVNLMFEILSEKDDIRIFSTVEPVGFLNFIKGTEVLTKKEKFEYILKISNLFDKHQTELIEFLFDLTDEFYPDKTNYEKILFLLSSITSNSNNYKICEKMSYKMLVERYDISEYNFTTEELKNFALSTRSSVGNFDVVFLGYFIKLYNKDTKIYFVKDKTTAQDKKYSDGICLYNDIDIASLNKDLFKNITVQNLIDFQNFMFDNNYFCQNMSILTNFILENILNVSNNEKIKLKKILALLPKSKKQGTIKSDISQIPYEYLKNISDMQLFYKDINEQTREQTFPLTNFLDFYVLLLEFKTFESDYSLLTFEQAAENIKNHFNSYTFFEELEKKVEELGGETEIFVSIPQDTGDIGPADKQLKNTELEKAWLVELHKIFNLQPEEKYIEFSYNGEEFVYTYFEINKKLLEDKSFVPDSQQAQRLINSFSVIKKELPQDTLDFYAKFIYSLLKRNPNLSVFSSAENNLELLDLLFEDFSVVKDDYIKELLDNYNITPDEYKKIISKTKLYFFNITSSHNNEDISVMERLNTVLPTLSDLEKIKFFFWLISGKDIYKPQMLKHVKLSGSDYDGEINFNSLRQSFMFMTKTERENFIRKIFLGESGILKEGKTNVERNSKELEKGLKNILFDDFFISSSGSSKIKASAISIIFKDVFSIVFNNLSNERKVLFVNNLLSSISDIKNSDERFDIEEELRAHQLGRLIVALGTSSGVAIVKLLQILSNNRIFEALDDKYGKIINEEVSKVKSENEPLSKSAIFQYLEKLGISDDIEYVGKRLGSASIGLTYLLKLKGKTELLVAKIKRPGINKNYDEDFGIADEVIKYFKSEKSNLDAVYKKTLPSSDKLRQLFDEELNFEAEAENLKDFNAQLRKRNSEIKVPQLAEKIGGKKAYTQNLFLQTTAKGTTLDKISVSKSERSRIYFNILKEFFTEVFVDPVVNGRALYHADLHTGNIFVNNNGTISFIDLGGVGEISAQQSTALKDIFMYLYAGKYNEFITALKSYNDDIYNQLSQANTLENIRNILNRKTSLETKFVDLFEIFNSLQDIDSGFMMFIQAISKISRYLDNLNKKEQLELLNNLNFDKKIKFKIITATIATYINSLLNKMKFDKKQKNVRQQEISKDDIFKEKMLSDYPDISETDIKKLLSLDTYILEYIKNNTVTLSLQQFIRCSVLADKLYKKQIINEKNDKLNLLFKIISITDFSDENIEKLLKLDENTIEKILLEIKENKKADVLFSKSEELNITLFYENGLKSNDKNFIRLLMFAKGASLNKDHNSYLFFDTNKEIKKVNILFNLPAELTKILLKDEEKFQFVSDIIIENDLSLDNYMDIIEILMSFEKSEYDNIPYEIKYGRETEKENIRRFFYLYKDYLNIFSNKSDVDVLFSIVKNNGNDDQIRELLNSTKNISAIRTIIYNNSYNGIDLASSIGLKIVLFRSKYFNIPIDSTNLNFTVMIKTLKTITSYGQERIEKLDEETYKKLFTIKDNDSLEKLLEYISKSSYDYYGYDETKFKELVNEEYEKTSLPKRVIAESSIKERAEEELAEIEKLLRDFASGKISEISPVTQADISEEEFEASINAFETALSNLKENLSSADKKTRQMVKEINTEDLKEQISRINKYGNLFTRLGNLAKEIENLSGQNKKDLEDKFLDFVINILCKNLVELYDNKVTKRHAERVMLYSLKLIDYLDEDFTLEEKYNLIISALMHDIGKNLIPKRILQDFDTFTSDKETIMRGHTWLGVSILKGSVLHNFVEIAANHHQAKYTAESLTGIKFFDFPRGKFTGIVNIADVYDAVSSAERIYQLKYFTEDLKVILKDKEFIKSIGADTKKEKKVIDALLLRIENINKKVAENKSRKKILKAIRALKDFIMEMEHSDDITRNVISKIKQEKLNRNRENAFAVVFGFGISFLDLLKDFKVYDRDAFYEMFPNNTEEIISSIFDTADAGNTDFDENVLLAFLQFYFNKDDEKILSKKRESQQFTPIEKSDLPKEFARFADNYNQFNHMEELPSLSRADYKGREKYRDRFEDEVYTLANMEHKVNFEENTRYAYILQHKNDKNILLNILTMKDIDIKFKLFASLYLDNLSGKFSSEERNFMEKQKILIAEDFKSAVETNNFMVVNNFDLRAYLMGLYILMTKYSANKNIPFMLERAVIVNSAEGTIATSDGYFSQTDFFTLVHELAHVMIPKPNILNMLALDTIDELVSYIMPNIIMRLMNFSVDIYKKSDFKSYSLYYGNRTVDYVKMGANFYALYNLFSDETDDRDLQQSEHTSAMAFLDMLYNAHKNIGTDISFDILLQTIINMRNVKNVNQSEMFYILLNSYCTNLVKNNIISEKDSEILQKEIRKMQLWTLMSYNIIRAIEAENPEIFTKILGSMKLNVKALQSPELLSKAIGLGNVNEFFRQQNISDFYDKILSSPTKTKEFFHEYQIAEKIKEKQNLSQEDVINLLIIEIIFDNEEYEKLAYDFDNIIFGIIDIVSNSLKIFEDDKDVYSLSDYEQIKNFVKDNYSYITSVKKEKSVSMETVNNAMEFISSSIEQIFFINKLINAIFNSDKKGFNITDRNLVVTESAEQKEQLQNMLAVEERNDIIIVNMDIIKEPTDTIRSGFMLDAEKGIRIKYNKDEGSLTVYSRQGINIDKRQIRDLIVSAYYETRKDDYFEAAIVFADTEDKTISSIENKLKNAVTNSVALPAKEVKLDISSRKNIPDIAAVCRNEEIATGTNIFIINETQAKKYKDELSKLRKSGYKFIISYDQSGDISEAILDGAKVSAEDILTSEKAIELLEKLKNIKLSKGINTQISVKFSKDVYSKLSIDIFNKYGIIPIVDDISVPVLGKKEIDISKKSEEQIHLTENDFENILRTENIVSIVIDENSKMFVHKNKSKNREAKTMEQKYKKGANAAMSFVLKFDYTVKDISSLLDTGILFADLKDAQEKIENFDSSLLSSQAQNYFESLKKDKKYEEALGFVRGVIMNTIAKNISNAMDIEETEFMKDIKTDTIQAILILTLQKMALGETISEIYKTNEISSNMSAKEFLDSIRIKLNGDLDSILRQNEYKIEKVSPAAIADFTGIPELLMDSYGRKATISKSAVVSTEYIRQLLSAA